MKNKLIISLSILMFLIFMLILSMKSAILLTISIILLILYLSKKDIKKFYIWLFLISLIIRLICIFILNYEQVYDFKILLDASKTLSYGDYSFNQWGHMKMWGYQTGFVIYQAFILKLFNNVMILKILNAIYSSFIAVIIYYLSKKITNEKIGRITSLLYMILPFPIFLNTILTNQHLATLLMYLSIIFLLKENDKTKDYIIASILLALSNIIRPEAIIILVTLIIYEICKISKEKIKETLKKLSIFIIIYLSINTLASQLIIKTGLNPVGLTNQDPLWKFVLGFNHETCGHYTQEDVYVQMDKEKSLNLIKERITQPPHKMIKLFTCKIDKFWLQSDIKEEANAFQDKTINILGIQIKFDKIVNIVMTFNNQIYLATLLLCAIGIIIHRKTKKLKKGLFFIIMLLVCFGVFLIIEIQPRYIYMIHIPIFVLSGYGIQYILNLKEKYIKQNLFTHMK